MCGDYHSEIDKRWLIDLDDDGKFHWEARVKYVRESVIRIQSKIENRDYSILAEIPSKRGLHIITNPFNLAELKELFPELEVHKNNPTNLYIP